MIKPLTSVLLPVYNGANYIESAIRSVLVQDSSFELLVQDDFSTDNTESITRSIRDERVKYAKNDKNIGCFGSLNAAAARANGELIRIFSHDDLMYPGDLSAIERVFSTVNAGLVISDHDKIDPEGNKFGCSLDANVDDWPIEGTAYGSRLARVLYLNGCISGTQSTITIKASIYKNVGGFTEWMKYSGDYDFLAKHGQAGGLHYLRTVTSAIRFHPSQLSKRGRVSAQSTRELSHILRYLESVMNQEDREYCRKRFVRVHGKQRGIAALKALARGETEPIRVLFREFETRRASASIVSAIPYLPLRALEKSFKK
jgi:glycosyltransferase involved in cell wall biosynthesis